MLVFSPPTSDSMLRRRTRQPARQHHLQLPQQLSPHRAITVLNLPTGTARSGLTGKMSVFICHLYTQVTKTMDTDPDVVTSVVSLNSVENWVSGRNPLDCKGAGYTHHSVPNFLIQSWARGRL